MKRRRRTFVSEFSIRKTSRGCARRAGTDFHEESHGRTSCECGEKTASIDGFSSVTVLSLINRVRFFVGVPRERISKIASGTKRGCEKRTLRFAKRSTVLRCTKRSWDHRRRYAEYFHKLARWPRRIPRF